MTTLTSADANGEASDLGCTDVVDVRQVIRARDHRLRLTPREEIGGTGEQRRYPITANKRAKETRNGMFSARGSNEDHDSSRQGTTTPKIHLSNAHIISYSARR